MFQFVIVIPNGQAKGKCYQLFANGYRLLCYIVTTIFEILNLTDHN